VGIYNLSKPLHPRRVGRGAECSYGPLAVLSPTFSRRLHAFFYFEILINGSKILAPVPPMLYIEIDLIPLFTLEITLKLSIARLT